MRADAAYRFDLTAAEQASTKNIDRMGLSTQLLNNIEYERALQKTRSWNGYAFARTYKEEAKLRMLENLYLSAFIDARKTGQAYVDSVSTYAGGNSQLAAMTRRNNSRDALIQAAREYDDIYLADRPTFRVVFDAKKKQILIDYLDYLEEQYKNRPCITPEAPVLSGLQMVKDGGKFEFDWEHTQIPGNMDRYELLEYSHVESPNWYIKHCWDDRKDMWHYTQIPLDSQESDHHADIMHARQPNSYEDYLFFRVRAWNNCGQHSKWSNPVWYEHEPQADGSPAKQWNRLSDWEYIKSKKCQKYSGERPKQGLSDADYKRVTDILARAKS